MNLNHLAIFYAVAQARSITVGAEQLHISQPAVSKQLQEFERALKTPLFDRLPRGVRLTEAGELLAQYAQRLFGLESEAEMALAELRGLERGRLAVGASLTIGGYLLPDILARFHLQFPGIELNVEIANTKDIQGRILDGTLDVAMTEGFVEHPELESHVFHTDEMVIIAPPDHPFVSAASVSAEHVSHERFVMREVGSGTRAVVERAFSERGLTLRPVMSLGSIEAIKRAVAARIGIAMVSALTIGLEVEANKLVIVPTNDLSVHRPLHRLYLRGRHQTHAARAFMAALENV